MSGDQRERGEAPKRGGPADPMTIVAKPHTGLASRLRNYFLAGLLVVAPVSITLWLTWEFVSFVDDTLTPLIPGAWRPSTYLPIDIPGIGLIIAAVGLVLIGFSATGLIGRWFMREGERLVDRVPIVRSVYGALKQIFETVLAQRSNAFRQVVLVEYPCRGTWAIGFITGTTKGEVQALTDDTVVNVFVPATPNPSTGFLLFVPKSDVRLLDMTTEEAAKLIISGGIITPPVRAEPLPAAQAEPGAVAEADISTAIGENVLEEHMSAEAAGEAEAPRRRPFGLLARLRNYMLAGILVIAPISITIWLTWNVIAFVDSRVTPLMPPGWNPESYLPFSVPGLGVLMVALALTLAGMFATGLLGRLVTSSYERLLNAVPVIRSVYSVTKQIFETVLAQRSNAFRQVVLIQYPRPDSWALAFVTADTQGDVARKAPEESLNLFLPTTPNPTSGFLLFVPRREAQVLSMTVEEGAKMIISGGIITPEPPAADEGAPPDAPQDQGDPQALAASTWTGRS
jgi:uncharacterized membrane protein